MNKWMLKNKIGGLFYVCIKLGLIDKEDAPTLEDLELLLIDITAFQCGAIKDG